MAALSNQMGRVSLCINVTVIHLNVPERNITKLPEAVGLTHSHDMTIKNGRQKGDNN